MLFLLPRALGGNEGHGLAQVEVQIPVGRWWWLLNPLTPLKLNLTLSAFSIRASSVNQASLSQSLRFFATAAMTYIVKAILMRVCVCVFIYASSCVFLPSGSPVHICARYSEGLCVCACPSWGSPVCVSRYRATLMCQLCLEEWTESWWTTMTHTHIHSHRKPPQAPPTLWSLYTPIPHTPLTFFLKAYL